MVLVEEIHWLGPEELKAGIRETNGWGPGILR